MKIKNKTPTIFIGKERLTLQNAINKNAIKENIYNKFFIPAISSILYILFLFLILYSKPLIS